MVLSRRTCQVQYLHKKVEREGGRGEWAEEEIKGREMVELGVQTEVPFPPKLSSILKYG